MSHGTKLGTNEEKITFSRWFMGKRLNTSKSSKNPNGGFPLFS